MAEQAAGVFAPIVMKEVGAFTAEAQRERAFPAGKMVGQAVLAMAIVG